MEAAEPVTRHVIMANPGISVSTPEAYEAIDAIGFAGKDAEKRRLFVNDLEKYTLAKYEKAAELKSLMEVTLSADEILMSGSGPTVAAYYKDEKRAAEDAKLLKDKESSVKGLRVWLTTTGT